MNDYQGVAKDFNVWGINDNDNDENNNNAYMSYTRADEGFGAISGTTDGPMLVSGEIDLSERDNYKLLLTGFDMPYINAGEIMPLYYDGKPLETYDKDGNVVLSGYGCNAVNYSVLYKLNIKDFQGDKIVFRYSPYTTPSYLSDSDSGIYIAYNLMQNGESLKNESQVILTSKYDDRFDEKYKEFVVDFSEIKDFEKEQLFNIYFTVSGMSVMPVMVSFE